MSVVAGPPSAVAEKAEETTMVIKKSCVFRAKFQIAVDLYIPPLQMVPHPMNRGGDPCKTLRCRSITSDIARHGCDVAEAEWNAVSIESPPDDGFAAVAEACCNPDYDAHFAENAIDENDMCVKHGLRIAGGSVSHSHLNCTLRNVQTGKVGCECSREPVVAGGAFQCNCGNACICDEKGRYSMAKIRARDPEWEQLALRGLKWQMLSWKVMLEPGAVLTISNALNVKNSIAMEVGGNEIFRYMCSLSNPAPEPTPFDPIRDHVIQMYGASGQDPHLVHAFQFILESGGRDSQLLNDYQTFQEFFCDPKNRRLDFSAYKSVNNIPPQFQRLRLAILLYTWKQPVNKTKWCASPPDISGRFDPDAKHTSWLDFLYQLEAVLSHIRFLVVGNTDPNGSVVAEGNFTAVGSVKQHTQWMLELNSSIIASLHAAVPPRKKAEQVKQLVAIQEKLAKLIGLKIRGYYKQHWKGEAVGASLKSKMPPYRNSANHQAPTDTNAEPTEDKFWTMVTETLYNDNTNADPGTDAPKARAVVAADLVPVASQMDDRGKLLSSHQTIPKGPPGIADELTFPFKDWMSSKVATETATDTAKRVLLHCIFHVNQHMRRRALPIRMVKKKNCLSVVAEEDLKAGELIIPLFCRRANSIVVEGEYHAGHHTSMGVDVEWEEPNISEHLECTGIEKPHEHQIALWVNSELRLPKTDDGNLEWTGQEDVHPFWVVRRLSEGEHINCEIRKQWVEQTTTIDWETLHKTGAKINGCACTPMYICYPFIVNHQDIPKGGEVVLQSLHVAPPETKKRQMVNAFDLLKTKFTKMAAPKSRASSST